MSDISDKSKQRADSLAHANEVRAARGAWKRWVREDDRPRALRLAVVLVNDPPEWADTWRASAMLETLPGIGGDAVRRALGFSGFQDRTTLAGLTDEQRKALCFWLEVRAAKSGGEL